MIVTSAATADILVKVDCHCMLVVPECDDASCVIGDKEMKQHVHVLQF
jgi:hypothetical protein